MTRRRSGRQSARAGATALAALVLCIVEWTGCTIAPPAAPDDSLFADAPALTVGGNAVTVANVAALGGVDVAAILEVNVRSNTGQHALVLQPEDETASTAIIVGGGPIGEPFNFVAPAASEYLIFIVHDPASNPDVQSAEIEVALATSQIDQRAERQLIYVEFEAGYLTEPGLLDPVDSTNEDRAFLESISTVVEQEVVTALQSTFAGTPIEITSDLPGESRAPYSTLRFSPERVLADQNDINDAALPPPDPTRPECQVRVIFGEVLPRGTNVDPGNQDPGDEAVVYVGSFQGRGQTCWTSAVGSLSSVVQTLSQTGAHEIGHLVGLLHVEQIDLMNRSATLAFLRDLEFARGQIQIDRTIGDDIAAEVFPQIVQNPQLYFDAIFQSEAADDEE